MAKKQTQPNDIVTYLNQRFASADTAQEKMQHTRASMLRYYRQDMSHIPSNEGESKISTSEVRDTVETLLPQILEPFLTGAGAGTFRPNSQQDIEQAKLETEYVKHVIFEKNTGFLVFTEWAKDGLLQKVGYVKAWWDDEQCITPEKYENLPIDEADLVAQDNENGSVIQFRATLRLPGGQSITIADEQQLLALLQTTAPEQLMQATVDLDLVRAAKDGKVMMETVAPENLKVEPGYRRVSLDKCNYCAESLFKSRHELKAMGYDPDLVDSLPRTSSTQMNEEASERAKDQTNITYQNQNLRGDDEIVEVREHYIRSDLDQSGIVKLWKVCTGSAASNVLLSQEMVSRIPYHAWTPIIQPHEHAGLSAAELVHDQQDVHTVLWRQSLNAVVANNRQRPVVSQGGATADTFDDLMKTIPGHPIRVNSPDAITWTAPPGTALQTLPLMQYLQDMTESRTGLSKQAQGLDAEALADSTNMVGAMVMNQSLLRVKMMLRTFAETGVRSLMEHVRELILKNQKRQDMFEYMGQYVQIDPTNWKGRRTTLVKVGLGYNDRLEKISALQSTANMQKDIVAMQGGADGPLVNIQNAYNVLDDLMTEQGLIAKGRYINNPAQNPSEPKPPSPTAIDVAEAELVSNNATAAAKIKADMTKHNIDTRVKVLELMLQDERERESLKLQKVNTFGKLLGMVRVNDNEPDTDSAGSTEAA